LTKRNNRVPHDQVGHRLPRWRYLLDDELLSNGLLEGINRLGWLRPSLIPRINQFSARVLPRREFTDTSYAVFTSPRRVRFKECEYAVPREAIVPVLQALRAWIEDRDERICFPVEVRVAAADDIWLSTAYQRASPFTTTSRSTTCATSRPSSRSSPSTRAARTGASCTPSRPISSASSTRALTTSDRFATG
jgi:L-gulono-1,4-lactone dehydrogenase